ncbi:putative transmembrane protein [Toxoplasma gondii RUB]|uniref:Putative transmembrane protein n=1 Tax=Toxoplasma gondii RUB TaxID=935652 RepID=A0A086LJW1_TOXGO|nr:putative transmembrane protein [Toxoplasma gondii RUB]
MLVLPRICMESKALVFFTAPKLYSLVPLQVLLAMAHQACTKGKQKASSPLGLVHVLPCRSTLTFLSRLVLAALLSLSSPRVFLFTQRRRHLFLRLFISVLFSTPPRRLHTSPLPLLNCRLLFLLLLLVLLPFRFFLRPLLQLDALQFFSVLLTGQSLARSRPLCVAQQKEGAPLTREKRKKVVGFFISRRQRKKAVVFDLLREQKRRAARAGLSRVDAGERAVLPCLCRGEGGGRRHPAEERRQRN